MLLFISKSLNIFCFKNTYYKKMLSYFDFSNNFLENSKLQQHFYFDLFLVLDSKYKTGSLKHSLHIFV